MTFHTRAAGIGLAFVLGVAALAGCTATDPEPTPTPTDAAVEPGVTDIEDAPGTGEDLVGAAADAITEACERDGDEWVARGTVTNPTDGEVDYRIYVSLLNSANDTRGLQQVDVEDLGAGDTADWESRLELADEDLSCVLRVERYEG